MTCRLLASLSVVLLLAGGPGLAQVDDFTPVTDAMLQDPAPADWLNWRRTLDAQAHSPLDQITTANAADLRLVWSWALANGSQQTTPLVYDGVMYVANPGEIVHALDAASGEPLWEYRRDAPPPGDSYGGPPPGRAHRNIAIYRDMIYLNTADAHVVALDARTGDVAWDTDVGQGVGFQFSSGAIVADGRVVSGLTGLRPLPRRHVLHRRPRCGHRPRAVEDLHHRPGPASAAAIRGATSRSCSGPGSDSWIPGSYDPITRTLFHGTSQAKPWARAARGTDGGRAVHELPPWRSTRTRAR